RAGQVAAVDVAGEPDDGAPGVGPPVRSEQTGERRDEVGTTVVVNGSGQLLNLRGGGDQPQVVPQPLHQRAGDGDRPFQAVDRVLITSLVADGGDQPVLAQHAFGSGVEQDEVAGSV